MEERELPVGWEIVDLGQITTVLSGNGFPKEHQGRTSGDFGFYKVSDISRSITDGQPSLSEARNYISAELAARLKATTIPSGSTVFAKIGEAISLNRRAITEFPCIVDNNVMAVKAAGEILDKYVYYFMRSQDLRKLSRATTVPSLRKSDIYDLQLPVPPLNEQRRIAAKLDTTLAAVDACRQRLDGVAAILKRFRQAVLAAATSGELTREWREERSDGLDWYQAKLSEICSSISDGDHQAPPKAMSGIPFITISAISDACLHLERASRFVPSSYYEGLAEARRAVPGDILYSVTGTLGVPALVETTDPFVFQRHIALIRPNRDFILPKYLYYCLLSDAIKRLCYEGATGTAQLTLPLGVLRNLRLKLPSLVEQAEILLQIENLFSLADQLEARLTATRRIVERLTPALLAKAFRGELVPQDPGDEPASVLLERIRAARQAEAAASGPPRRGRKKAAANPATVALEAAPVPPDHLAALLKECGALSERALLAASELEPACFRAQLALEQGRGAILATTEDGGQVLLEASA
jgi:type I restriction enzyme S subunit